MVGLRFALGSGFWCRIFCEDGCCWDDCETRKLVMLCLGCFVGGVLSSGVGGVNGGVASGLGGIGLRFPLRWCAIIFQIRLAPEGAAGV